MNGQLLPDTLIRDALIISAFGTLIREILEGFFHRPALACLGSLCKAVPLAVPTGHLRALGAFISKRYVSWRAAPRSADLVRLPLTHALRTHAAPRITPETSSSSQDDVQARPTEEARRGAFAEAHL